MSFEAIDEHERSLQLQNWLRTNLGSLILLVAAVFGVIAGVHWWRGNAEKTAMKAAQQYESLAKQLEAKDEKATAPLLAELKKSKASEGYAVMAALAQAQAAHKKNDKAAVDEAMKWAKSSAQSAELKALVDLRHARIHYGRGEFDAALSTVKGISIGGFDAMARELEGDVLVALKRPSDAHAAYEKALTAMDAAAAGRSQLEMKRDDVAAANTNAAAKSTEAKS